MVTPMRRGRGAPEETRGLSRLNVRVNGESIAVWLQGDGPRLLLVHGWNGDHQHFAAWAPAILAAGFSFAALDLPGHGASEGEITPIPHLAGAVLGVGQALGALQGVVAHSVGCAAASYALSQGLDARAAVLLASPFRYMDRALGVAGAAKLSDADLVTFLDELGRLGAGLETIDAARYGPAIRQPSLFFHSQDDRIIPAAAGEAAAAAFAAARFVPLTGLGHSRILKDPGVISTSLAFLADPTAWPSI